MRRLPSPSLWPVALGGVAALTLAMGVGRFVYTPILPAMLREGALDIDQAGFVAAANFAGYLAGALMATRVAPDRRWSVLRLAVILSAVTTAAGALPMGAVVFGLVRCLSGIASAYALILTAAIAGQVFAAAGWRWGTAIVFTGVGTGIIVSSVAVRFLGAQPWPVLWLAAGAIAAVAGTVALWGLGHASAGAAAGGTSGGTPRPVRFWLVLIGYGLFGFGYVVHATYLPTMVAQIPALKPYAVDTWLLVGVAALASPLLWTAVSRRTSLDVAIVAALLVETAGVVAPALLGVTLPSVALAGLGLGGTFVAITVLTLVRGAEISPYSRATTTALLTAAFGAGQAAGPAIAGVLVARTGSFDPATWAAAACLAVAAVITAAALFSPPRP